MRQQLSALLKQAPPAFDDARQLSPVQHQAVALAFQCWQAVAFQQTCWSVIMPSLLSCVRDEQALLQQLLEPAAEAATTAAGLDRLCGALAGLQGCSRHLQEAVHRGVSEPLLKGGG